MFHLRKKHFASKYIDNSILLLHIKAIKQKKSRGKRVEMPG